MGWSGINLHLSKLKLSHGGQIYEFGMIYMLHDILKTSLRQGKVQGRCFFVRSKPWHSGQKVDKKPLYFQIGKIFDSFFLSSLLRHHPSAVSCDDSDLLLEESCVMDISTEVLYFPWI